MTILLRLNSGYHKYGLLRAIAALLLSCQANSVAQLPASPLRQAHAHNDYLHERPLLDAVQNRFASVEADIFLVDGELLVAHAFWELDKNRTLQKLYLDPLKELIQANEGTVFKEATAEFTLLIDIKNKGAETYQTLHRVLGNYPQLVSHVKDGTLHRKAVRVIISGDRAIDVIRRTSPRLAGIDGRLTDLDTTLPNDLMPLISDNWRNHFKWRGKGPIPKLEKAKLNSLVSKAHATGRRIRFWATPDTKDVWTVLQEAGVDLINTDDLDGLKSHLEQLESDSQSRDSRSVKPKQPPNKPDQN